MYDSRWLNSRVGQLHTGMADGMSAGDLHFLQRLYSSMDEPDGMAGIACMRSASSSLSEQIRDHLSVGRWSDALTCYDQALQAEQGQGEGDLELHRGFLDCLLHLGRLSESLIYVQGVLAVPTPAAWQQELHVYGLQAAWRLRRWDLVNGFLQRGATRSFQVDVASILSALHARDEPAYAEAMRAARDAVMASLSAASWESYQRAYPFCLQLQALQEIEQVRRVLGPIPASFSSSTHQAAHQSAVASLHQHWTLRLSRTVPSFKVREPLLSIRRVLYEEYGETAHAASSWLEIAHQARKARQFETATGALLRAESRQVDVLVLAVAKAKLTRAKGDKFEALLYLERHFNDSRMAQQAAAAASTFPSSSALSHPASPLSPSTAAVFAWLSPARAPVFSHTCLLLAKWHQELRSRGFHGVWDLLSTATVATVDSEKAKFRMADFYDRLMHEQIAYRRKKEPEVAAAGAASASSASLSRKASFPRKVLQQCLLYYGEALRSGHKYTFQCLPRMLTLYLEQAERAAVEDGIEWKRHEEKDRKPDVKSESSSSSSSKRSTRTSSGSVASFSTASQAKADPDPVGDRLETHKRMLELVAGIAAYKWYTALPQLISRLSHPNPYAARFISRALEAVLLAFPLQAVWSIGPIAKSRDKARKSIAKRLHESCISRMREARGAKAAEPLLQAMQLFDNLIAVCDPAEHGKPDGSSSKAHSGSVLSMKQLFSALAKTANIRVLVPVQSALTITLPSADVSASAAGQLHVQQQPEPSRRRREQRDGSPGLLRASRDHRGLRRRDPRAVQQGAAAQGQHAWAATVSPTSSSARRRCAATCGRTAA